MCVHNSTQTVVFIKYLKCSLTINTKRLLCQLFNNGLQTNEESNERIHREKIRCILLALNSESLQL